MYVTCYDGNTCEWSTQEWATHLEPGPEAGLAYLCSLQDDKEEGCPIGPIKYSGDTGIFILVAAWTGGRQWFKILIIMSKAPISNTWAKSILARHLPYEGEDEDEDRPNNDKASCLSCGWTWNQNEALDNYHGCQDDDRGVKTRCPKCGWCSVCDRYAPYEGQGQRKR